MKPSWTHSSYLESCIFFPSGGKRVQSNVHFPQFRTPFVAKPTPDLSSDKPNEEELTTNPLHYVQKYGQLYQ